MISPPPMRIGYGAMRLTGPGAWGPPPAGVDATRVLQAAREHGVTWFDTSDAYGPHLSEEQIREALHPYEGLTVVTKGGQTRSGPTEWVPVGRPEYLRQCAALSLRRLDVEALDLYLLHRRDPQVPWAEQVGALAELMQRGWVREIGLSNVTVPELTEAQQVAPISVVQNRYNLAERQDEEMVEYCTRNGLVYMAWFPVARGVLSTAPDQSLPTRPGPPDPEVPRALKSAIHEVADRQKASAAAVSLAWLLARSPAIVPIPGTTDLGHLADNCAAAQLELTDTDLATLNAASKD